jgi:heme-degrading monooxygenase HmoA
MVHILVRHRVKDYAQWKNAFEEHADVRKMAGSKGGRLFRERKNQNDVAVLFEWDDMAKARIFFESDDLRRVMERAGIIDRPEIFYEVEKVSC